MRHSCTSARPCWLARIARTAPQVLQNSLQPQPHDSVAAWMQSSASPGRWPNTEAVVVSSSANKARLANTICLCALRTVTTMGMASSNELTNGDRPRTRSVWSATSAPGRRHAGANFVVQSVLSIDILHSLLSMRMISWFNRFVKRRPRP